MAYQLTLAAVLFVFCLAVIHGAITDMTTYTIPNWVSYSLVPLFAVYAALRWAQTPVLLHVALGFAVFVICIVFWKLRWLGGGDVKFVGAISLWMGPHKILAFMLLLALGSAVVVSFLRVARDWNPYFQGGKIWFSRYYIRKYLFLQKLKCGRISEKFSDTDHEFFGKCLNLHGVLCQKCNVIYQ